MQVCSLEKLKLPSYMPGWKLDKICNQIRNKLSPSTNVPDLEECSATVDGNNNNIEVAMAIPDAADAASSTGVIGLSQATSEWVFIGLILALSAAVAVLWIEYKRLKKDKRTLRNLLSQARHPVPT